MRCQDLLGHTAGVSQLEVGPDSRALSGSYDRTLRLWDCKRGAELGRLAGHPAAVLHMDWQGSHVLSGDRGGAVKWWDLPTATCLETLTTGRGQIGALAHFESAHAAKAGGEGATVRDEGALALIGDQAGVFTAWEPRQGKRPLYSATLHPGGVLSGIRTVLGTPYVVTCGADQRVLVLDVRQNFSVVHELKGHTDFIYTLEVFGPMVLSGAGNGWLLVHDALSGECCYGLGANTAAVRALFASSTLLVAAGDDGKATVYEFA